KLLRQWRPVVGQVGFLPSKHKFARITRRAHPLGAAQSRQRSTHDHDPPEAAHPSTLIASVGHAFTTSETKPHSSSTVSHTASARPSSSRRRNKAGIISTQAPNPQQRSPSTFTRMVPPQRSRDASAAARAALSDG